MGWPVLLRTVASAVRFVGMMRICLRALKLQTPARNHGLTWETRDKIEGMGALGLIAIVTYHRIVVVVATRAIEREKCVVCPIGIDFYIMFKYYMRILFCLTTVRIFS